MSGFPEKGVVALSWLDLDLLAVPNFPVGCYTRR